MILRGWNPPPFEWELNPLTGLPLDQPRPPLIFLGAFLASLTGVPGLDFDGGDAGFAGAVLVGGDDPELVLHPGEQVRDVGHLRVTVQERRSFDMENVIGLATSSNAGWGWLGSTKHDFFQFWN